MVKKLAMVFIFIIFLTAYKAYAVFDCLTLTNSSREEDKEFCKKELADIENELNYLLEKQKEQQKQIGTLKGDVNYLTSQINALKAKIKARNLKIAQLQADIKGKIVKIETLSEKIKREHESLAQLLRNTNDFDNKNLIYLMFSNEDLSVFYSDLESYASINKAIKTSVDHIRGIRNETEAEKQSLEKKQDDETDAKVELESAEKKVAQSEAEKKVLLAISKSKEAEYQKVANEKKARADKIRSALFPLRDAEAIPFGVALQYAEEAEKKTGVRPAFVLAILKQETNLGANVGSCVIANLSTGETRGLNGGQIFSKGIHPTRDLPLLQVIVKELGRDPLNTRVSCPQAVGYGGAMGPAQFIPSTWNIIKSQITNAIGRSIPDPWNPADAIMASSILLRGNGAGARTYTAERNAACKYYSGRSCSDPTVRNAFYGDAVMAFARQIQADIDLLSG